jgi:hypothetical protein
MARIRTIKPSAFTSLTLAGVPIEARWLFAGLWTEADDAGRLIDHPGLINARIFPLDKLPDDRVNGWLEQLAATGAICRYDVGGEHFLHPVKWQHQRIQRPTPSTLPGCPVHHAAPGASSAPTGAGGPPVAQRGRALADPRRCSQHQLGAAVPCGACKEARVRHEESVKSRPTFTGPVTMCGEHPEHRALNCPECAAAATGGAPADWRNRGAASS